MVHYALRLAHVEGIEIPFCEISTASAGAGRGPLRLTGDLGTLRPGDEAISAEAVHGDRGTGGRGDRQFFRAIFYTLVEAIDSV